jgi:peptide/nickel transport system permease protein
VAIAEPYVPPGIGTLRGRPMVRGRQRQKSRAAVLDRLAIAVLLLVTILAVFVPLIAPYSPDAIVGNAFIHPSVHFLFGTDDVGRDIFSRVLYGLRASWFSALEVITSGVLFGGLIGLIAGSAGGWIDTVLMRFTDVFLALPGPVLAIAVVAALGPSLDHTLVAVAIVWWPFYSRIVRGEVRSVAARPHLKAARLAGVGRVRLAVRHLLPGAIPATLVTASLDVGNLVLTLAARSFLGLGAPEPAPELGAMSAQGLTYLLTDWWVPVMPGLAILFLALASNLAGDGLRDLMGER